MTFTEAKNEFNSKYQFIKEYTCFLPEHLIMKRETKVRKKNGEHNSQLLLSDKTSIYCNILSQSC